MPNLLYGSVNWVFKPYLDKFVVIFIDDILIHSKANEEHVKDLQLVWKTQEERKLHVSLRSVSFGWKRFTFWVN